MDKMIKIKTFNHYNDEMINEFLKQTKGKIVCYNPITIEYDANIKFTDPYKGYNAYEYRCRIEHTPMDNINKEGVYSFIDETLLQKRNIDTVLFNKIDGTVKFMYKGKLCFDTKSGDYCHVRLALTRDNYGNVFTPLSTRDFQGEGFSCVDYNFLFFADSAWAELFDFESYLKALECKKINFQ